MKTLIMLSLLLAPGFMAADEAAPKAGMGAAAETLLSRQFMKDFSSAKAAKSIRGAKALWTDLVVQKPGESAAFSNLEIDLKTSDLDGQLKAAGMRVMDPKKRSLGLGLRPTLVLLVLRSPAGSETEKGFYLVVASAVQDVTPLGGETLSLTTWLRASEPIEFSGDDHKDADAIRIAAREGVKAFIATAKDELDEVPGAKK